MPFDRNEYRRLEPLLGRARSAALLTHVNPDGDGVGSSLALARYLRGRGIDARFMTNRPIPAALRFLAPNGDAIPWSDGGCEAFVRRADLVFTLDNSSVERLGPFEPAVRASSAPRICIDHHLVREPFWSLNLVDEEATATGEMVHDCIRALGGTLDLAMAEPLYVAIWTDTGGFRFSKTGGRIHRVVADLLDRGVKPNEVYHHLFEQNTPGYIRLLGTALAQARISADGRLAWVELPHGLFVECGAEDEDTSDIVNHLLSIAGVEIGLLFRGLADGSTKISLRSRSPHDVNLIAMAHGGGGHRNAAGAVVAKPVAESARLLVAEATAALG
jgi:bifunctional oligoribonuclease and PAP phosphatase NrnA